MDIYNILIWKRCRLPPKWSIDSMQYQLKSEQDFWVEIDKMILKLWKHKGPRIAKIIFKERTMLEDVYYLILRPTIMLVNSL